MNLSTSAVYPDDEAFIDWLEQVTTDHLADDAVEYLKSFVTVPDLIDDFIAEALVLRINES